MYDYFLISFDFIIVIRNGKIVWSEKHLHRNLRGILKFVVRPKTQMISLKMAYSEGAFHAIMD